jgi:hypothetical protein
MDTSFTPTTDDGVDGYTLHVHKASGGKGYTLHAYTLLEVERDTPSTSTLSATETDTPGIHLMSKLLVVERKTPPCPHC